MSDQDKNKYWIDVNDRLPEEKDRRRKFFLVCNGLDLPEVARLTNHGWELLCGYKVTGITHWMDLPEPPKRIRPCPFCGSVPVLYTHSMDGYVAMKCMNKECHHMMDTGPVQSEDEALLAWDYKVRMAINGD